MNILPKKRWHVRNRENIARVRKDEAAAANEEKEREYRRRKAEQEVKIEILRSRVKRKNSPSLELETKQICESNERRHINFFETDDTLAINEEHERELKEEKEKYEKQIGYLTYLGQGTNEANGCVSWYNKSKFDFENALKIDPKKDEKSKSTLDPLKGIEKIFEKKRNLNCEEEQVKFTDKCDRRGKNVSQISTDAKRSDKNTPSCKTKRKHEKCKQIEILREKRLKREREERAKIEKHLTQIKGVENCKLIEKREKSENYLQKYHSQFHPHLARQNHNE